MPGMRLVKGRYGYLGSIILYKLFYYFFQSLHINLAKPFLQSSISCYQPTKKKHQAKPQEDILPRLWSSKFRQPPHPLVLYSSGVHIGFPLVSHRLKSDRDSRKCARNSSLASLKYPVVLCQADILLETFTNNYIYCFSFRANNKSWRKF